MAADLSRVRAQGANSTPSLYTDRVLLFNSVPSIANERSKPDSAHTVKAGKLDRSWRARLLVAALRDPRGFD